MTSEAIERAVALRRQRVSYQVIAATMGWSRPTTLKHVKAAMGNEAADACRRVSRAGTAAMMRTAGESYEAIAAALGYADAIRATHAVSKWRSRHELTPAVGTPKPTPRAVPPSPPQAVDHVWHALRASRTWHCAVCGIEVRDPAEVEWTCAEWRAEQGGRRRGSAAL